MRICYYLHPGLLHTNGGDCRGIERQQFRKAQVSLALCQAQARRKTAWSDHTPGCFRLTLVAQRLGNDHLGAAARVQPGGRQRGRENPHTDADEDRPRRRKGQALEICDDASLLAAVAPASRRAGPPAPVGFVLLAVHPLTAAQQPFLDLHTPKYRSAYHQADEQLIHRQGVRLEQLLHEG